MSAFICQFHGILTRSVTLTEPRYEVLDESLDEVEAAILLNGPMYLSQVQEKLKTGRYRVRKRGAKEDKRARYAANSVRRHLVMLVEDGDLRVYRSPKYKSGRLQTYYGLTLIGFLRSFTIPGGIAKRNLCKILNIWLNQPKFHFFFPKDEVMKATAKKNVELQLADYFHMLGNVLPESERVVDYLVGIPDQLEFLRSIQTDMLDIERQESEELHLIVYFANDFAAFRFGEQYLSVCRGLTKNLPTFRGRIRRYLDVEKKRLGEFESYVLGDGS